MSRLTGNRCECCACGQRFNAVSTFDRHRSGPFEGSEPRRCACPAALLLRGWSQNAGGFWVTRRMPNEVLRARRSQ